MRSREEREQDIQYLKSMIYYAVEVNEHLNRAKRYNYEETKFLEFFYQKLSVLLIPLN